VLLRTLAVALLWTCGLRLCHQGVAWLPVEQLRENVALSFDRRAGVVAFPVAAFPVASLVFPGAAQADFDLSAPVGEQPEVALLVFAPFGALAAFYTYKALQKINETPPR
ncbi:unnamed protein product, partial [Polarella glacialis]